MHEQFILVQFYCIKSIMHEVCPHELFQKGDFDTEDLTHFEVVRNNHDTWLKYVQKIREIK